MKYGRTGGKTNLGAGSDGHSLGSGKRWIEIAANIDAVDVHNRKAIEVVCCHANILPVWSRHASCNKLGECI